MKRLLFIAAMIMSAVMAVNAQAKENIYGTWKSVVDNGTETITIVISQNAMTITKVEHGSEKKIEYYKSVSYNAKKHKLKAHQYKEVETENGVTNEKKERDTEVFYVRWIDSNHIQLGDHPDRMDGDYGTLARQ